MRDTVYKKWLNSVDLGHKYGLPSAEMLRQAFNAGWYGGEDSKDKPDELLTPVECGKTFDGVTCRKPNRHTGNCNPLHSPACPCPYCIGEIHPTDQAYTAISAIAVLAKAIGMHAEETKNGKMIILSPKKRPSTIPELPDTPPPNHAGRHWLGCGHI